MAAEAFDRNSPVGPDTEGPMTPGEPLGLGTPTAPAVGEGAVEEVEVRGHIVDSLLLPKILDRILQMGGTFEIHECKIGVRRSDPSYARIGIRAGSPEAIDAIIGDLVDHARRRTGDRAVLPRFLALR